MADQPADKKYSEDEHLAIVADRVTRETSALASEKAELTTQKSELETKLDVEIAAKEAEKLRADNAEQALADYKAEVEGQREAAARKDVRIAAVKEAAPHLDDAFFTDEKRVTRILAMEEDSFTEYVADLKAVVPTGTTKQHQDIPRETAMEGASGGDETTVSPAAAVLFHGRFAPDTSKGA